MIRKECVDAITQAIGRQLNQAELQGIEDRLSRHLRDVGRHEPDRALGMSQAERLAEAAATASQELVHEARLKKRRTQLSVVAAARVDNYLRAHDDPFAALSHLIAFDSTAQSNVMSIETRANAIRNDALRRMIDTLEATDPRFFGLFEDVQGIRDLVYELHGQATGNEVAAHGAKVFHEVAEAMRQRFNRGGGDVGQRDDWGMPHHHSQTLVAKAGKEAWIADVLPLLDRSQYVNTDGSLMTSAEVTEFLKEAWTTIATGGANKIEPGRITGNGMRANRGNEARQVHFKSGEAYLQYHLKYSDRPLYDVLIGHVSQMARDIALVETLGPNPDHAYAFFRDRAIKEASEANPTESGKARAHGTRLDNLYRYVAGQELPMASERLARLFDNVRNWLSASKLGSAFLTSFSDNATLHLTAHVNNLPEMQLIRNQLATLNPANRMEKRLALRAGLAMNAYIGNLNRFGSEMLGGSFTRKLANTTLRASGLIAATEARKRAFGVTFMSALGQVTREAKTLDALDAGDWRILKSKGITPEDWEVWRRAMPEDWGNGNDTMLTPDSIYRIPNDKLAKLGDPQRLKEQAVTRLLGTVGEEMDMAVIEPGAKERAGMAFGLQRGTWKGELARSVMLFKSFPISMITRHLRRGWSMPTGTGRAAYLAALIAGTTVAGMVSLEAANVAAGRDPLDVTDPKTWFAAMLKGGALSLYGDFLFADTTRYGATPFESLAGPVAGLAADVLRITQGNIYKNAEGRRVNMGADIVNFLRWNTPVINLWYTRAAMNHLIFNRLQEHFSPGYLHRMERRSRRVYGQRYWWEPDRALPDRLPSAKAAVGEK